MAYDPQRKHERRRVTQEEGPAPVDAFLEDASATGNGDRTSPSEASGTAGRPATSPTEPAGEPGPWDEPSAFDAGPDRRLVVVVAFGLVVVAILLLGRRRRRRRRRADEAA